MLNVIEGQLMLSIFVRMASDTPLIMSDENTKFVNIMEFFVFSTRSTSGKECSTIRKRNSRAVFEISRNIPFATHIIRT